MSDDAEARKAQTTALFSRLAPEYDPAGCFGHFGRRLVDVVGVDPGQWVLDVATGRGAVLFPAVERVGHAGDVVGVDLAEGMVKATQSDIARRGIRADVQVMDAEQLDFPDATFDRVLCGFGVMGVPNMGGALDEFRRVLKPTGRLGVSTWRVSESEDLSAALEELGLKTPRPGWITEPDALMRPLERAGFSDVRVVADHQTFVYADLDAYWQNARGTGQRRDLDRLDAEQLERIREILAERLGDRQQSDGIHVVATALLAVASR